MPFLPILPEMPVPVIVADLSVPPAHVVVVHEEGNFPAWQDGAFPSTALPSTSVPPDQPAPDLTESETTAPETTESETTAPETAEPETAETPTPEGQPVEPPEELPLTLQADRQIYIEATQSIFAQGNVRVEFGDARLASERLWVNLENRYIRAEEDVLLNRNNQILAGSILTYNLSQGAGTVEDARGELALRELEEDFSPTFSSPRSATPFDPLSRTGAASEPVAQRWLESGSISEVTSPGGISLGTDSRDLAEGEEEDIRRLRFEADRLSFDALGWQADSIRLTNDPFSPPEIEFRGDTARLTPLNVEEDELVITNPRIVFEQGFSVPLLRDRIILRRGQIDTNDLNPLPTAIGIDGRDRDGVYIEREFPVRIDPQWRLTLVPQFYIQRWIDESDLNLGDPANWGLVTRLQGSLGPQTSVTAIASLSGLDLSNFENRLRASVRGQRRIGDHFLNLEYSYRDRLFNGSLGFQDVQTSVGAVLISPVIRLGDTQIDLTYQLSGQYVTATTDQPDLLGPNPPDNLASLFRFQGSVTLGRGFTVWQGTALPATLTEGLRYSPRPVTPFLQLVTGLRGITTYYTNGDLQETLTASVGMVGQFGQFSRPYFDYTRFNLIYSQSLVGGATSPFLFDRDVDRNVLSGGILQQIYGPFLLGFQTSFNVQNGREIDTEIILEYSRRAYGLVFRYNPVQTTGFIGFRLSGFNWTGRTTEFDGSDWDGEASAIELQEGTP